MFPKITAIIPSDADEFFILVPVRNVVPPPPEVIDPDPDKESKAMPLPQKHSYSRCDFKISMTSIIPQREIFKVKGDLYHSKQKSDTML